MEIQYKPSKPKKEKPARAPKTPKAEKTMRFGSAHSVKIDKPKKVKEPKAPKPEKAVSFTPSKVEKAQKFEKAGKLKQPVNAKILAAVLVAVAVIVAALAILPNLQDNTPEILPLALAVTNAPSKTTYYVGEVASFSDLKLELTMTTGAKISVGGSECVITGFDSSAPAENQVITATYKELQATFTVTIKELLVDPPVGNYSGISFKTLPKTEYKVNEWIDRNGGVLLVHYDDGTTREMSLNDENVKIYGFSTSAPGTYTLTVKYVEAGLYGETTYTITVTE